jgi:hypothetical protein
MAFRRLVRCRCLIALLTAVAFLACSGAAFAHMRTPAAVQLEVGTSAVTGHVAIALPQLELALGRKSTASLEVPRHGKRIERYLSEHVSASGEEGQAWTVEVGRPVIVALSTGDTVITPIELRPRPGSGVGDFELHYDAIFEAVSHAKAFVTLLPDSADSAEPAAKTLGVLSPKRTELRITGPDPSWWTTVGSLVEEGVSHIVEGADHMLFLLMLLLIAPMVAVGGRWQRAASPWTSFRRVVHIVTAFALGHSVTLGLATAGVVNVPSRPVEIFIAVSVGVTAVHAIRPLVHGREALLAASFGLVHGIAFAALIEDMGLERSSLLASLLGFNLGIELAQLMIVALAVPSLYLLSRTKLYPAIRVAGATFGLAAALGWFVQRVTESVPNPLEPAMTGLTDHGLLIAIALAALAAIAILFAREDDPPDVSAA